MAAGVCLGLGGEIESATPGAKQIEKSGRGGFWTIDQLEKSEFGVGSAIFGISDLDFHFGKVSKVKFKELAKKSRVMIKNVGRYDFSN